MICSKCGTMNSEEAAFCKNCGVSLIAEEVQTTDTVEEITENSVISIIKKIASSGLFLAGAICISVSAFLQFISAFSGSVLFSYIETLMDLSNIEGYSDMPEGVFGIMGTAFTGVSLISVIPLVLVVIGLWLCYTSAKNNENKTTGLSIIRGVVIYEIVAMSVGIGLVLLLLILGMGMSSALPSLLGEEFYVPVNLSAGVIMAIAVVLFIMVVAIFVIDLILYIKALKTIKTLKTSLASGILSGKISMFLIIMLFIMGASCALTFDLSGMSLGAAYILFGICLNQLREELSRQA